MEPGGTRFYRQWHNTRLNSFIVEYRETDLIIRVPKQLPGAVENQLQERCLELVRGIWERLETYIKQNPGFKESLIPLELPEGAPEEAVVMAGAARRAGVGPLAAVAGLFAERVGREILKKTDEVIVENGGDVFLALKEEGVVGVYAGPHSPFTGKLGLRIPAEITPLGICTSAGSVGPSLSLGRADAVIVLSQSTVLADAAATAVGNLVKETEDIEEALEQARQIEGVTGTVIIKGQRIGAWGQVDFVRTQPHKR